MVYKQQKHYGVSGIVESNFSMSDDAMLKHAMKVW